MRARALALPWRTVGRIAEGGSSTSPRQGRRRSPARRCSGSRDCTKSKRRSAAGSAPDRYAARQARSKPLVAALKLWFEQRAAELPRKSALAEAIGYALNQWDGLVR